MFAIAFICLSHLKKRPWLWIQNIYLWWLWWWVIAAKPLSVSACRVYFTVHFLQQLTHASKVKKHTANRSGDEKYDRDMTYKEPWMKVNADMLEMNKIKTLHVFFLKKKHGNVTSKIKFIHKWCWSWLLLSAAARSAPPHWASCSGPVKQ